MVDKLIEELNDLREAKRLLLHVQAEIGRSHGKLTGETLAKINRYAHHDLYGEFGGDE